MRSSDGRELDPATRGAGSAGLECETGVFLDEKG
jgi:hypothetical protein